MRWLPILLVTLGCGPKAPPPALVVDSPDDLDEPTLNAIVAELVPLVEQAAGVAFETPPHARLGRIVDMRGILRNEFLLVFAEMYDVPDFVLEQLADQAEQSAPGIVGKWGIQTAVLYLSPEAVARVTESAGLPPEDVGDVARLVLAHEMAHGLQQQVAPWGDIALRDSDHLDAERGVTEGHANWVEKRVADALGLDEARNALNLSQGWSEDGPTGLGSFELWALYGQGMRFVDHHYQRGGLDAVWTVVREPPASTSMLFRPETYAPSLPDSALDPAVFDGVAEQLTEGRWIPVRSRVGEITLRKELIAYPADDVDLVLSHLVDAIGEEALRDDRSADLRVLVFDGPEWPLWFIDLVGAPPPEAPGEEVPDDVPMPEWTFEITPVDGLEGAVNRRIGLAGMGVRFEANEVLVPRGDTLYVVRVTGFRPGLRMGRAVDQLLTAAASSAPE